MCLKFVSPVLLLFFALHCSSHDVPASDEVVFVSILYRHGDRTPIGSYPNDPYQNESLWPVPFGELTNVGKHQHLMLGRWLRNRYSGLIPRKFNVKDVYVRSTDVDRTLMSAQANLAGLYPPVDDQKWDIKDWMPIPVHTVPEMEDHLLATKKPCARYQLEYQKVLNSPEIKKLDENNHQLYEYLSIHSGAKISSLEQLEYLYNTLFIESIYNMTLPEWTKSVFPDKMSPLADWSFVLETYNKQLQRLKSGPLLKEILRNMLQKALKKLSPDRKMVIYSGHDITLANLMNTLGIFEPHSPPYAAALLLELNIDNTVSIYYKNDTNARLMSLPGCNASCPLEQFYKLVKDVIPKNWEKECSQGYNSGITTMKPINYRKWEWEARQRSSDYHHRLTAMDLHELHDMLLLLLAILLLGFTLVMRIHFNRRRVALIRTLNPNVANARAQRLS